MKHILLSSVAHRGKVRQGLLNKLLCLLVLSGFYFMTSATAFASQFKGGQITYKYLGGGSYEMLIKGYWDKDAVGNIYPYYEGSPRINTLASTVSKTLLPDGVTVEHIQKQRVTWSTPGLHKITWSSCCRGQGSNFGANEAGLFAAVNYNPEQPSSSPQFYDIPVFNFPVDKPINYNFNVEDPDGHELEYSLEQPYGIFEDTYEVLNQKGFKITTDGKILWNNPIKGLWLVNVKVKEKVNGNYTGAYVLREFILNIDSFINEAPQFTPIAQKYVKEGEPISFDIETYDNENVTIKATGSVFEKGATFSQHVQGNEAKATFSWTPPKGTYGNFVVQFSATDAHIMPLSSQMAVTVTVVPANCGVVATATVNTLPCEGSSNGQITMAGSYGIAPFMYSLDGGATFKAEALFSNLAAGTYKAVVKDANGCLSAPVTVLLQAQEPVSVSFTTPSNTICASGNPLRLTGGAPENGSYYGVGVKEGVFYPAVAGKGSHTIYYTHTNSNGCANTAAAAITVSEAPIISAGNDQTVYYGYASASCAILTASATGNSSNYTYKWSNGATTQAIEVCPVTTTTYTVTASDPSGCTSTDEVTVYVYDIRCGNKLDKVSICHNGETLCVAPEVVQAHLNHGDVLGDCSTGVNNSNALESSKMTVYPNPMKEKAQLSIMLREHDFVKLDITDVNGKLVKKLFEGNLAADQELKFDLDRSIGNKKIYVGRLSTSRGIEYIKIIVD